jgi:NAD(P)-dependent dehydrogenase (short-subunit alcohol dehydrogenase family)
MFQTPLHFDRTGVRVVAMCPGYTTSNIFGGGDKYLVAEWKELKKNELQP